MIIEYDIYCFERTLRIKFPEGYEHLKDEILAMLDDYYDEWHGTLVGMHTCLEEYMMDRLSETYNMWDSWVSVGNCDDDLIEVETDNVVKNLITAVINYALEYQWCDSEAIDTLVGCGITEQDFINCGYGEFVKDYFKE